MLEIRHLAGAPEETVSPGFVFGELAVEHLDGDNPAHFLIIGFPYGGKAALADLFGQAVAIFAKSIFRLKPMGIPESRHGFPESKQ